MDMKEGKQELKNKIIETLEIYRIAPDLVGQYLSGLEGLWTEDDTLRDFLGSPEVQLTTSTANRWANIYKAFCKGADYLIKDIVFNKTKKNWIYKNFFARDLEGNIKPIISRDSLDEWISRAKILSATDFTIFKKQHDHPVSEDHKHEWGAKEQWECTDCHEKSWIDPTQS